MAIIEKPINLINVANTLGYYEYKPHPVTGVNSRYVDLRRLCTHPNINKWAKYKPVRFNKIEELTEAELQSTNYGLRAYEVPDIVSFQKVGGGVGVAMNIPIGWAYTKPNGGALSPFRTGDFGGYNKEAVPAITDVNNIEITDTNIQQFDESNIDIKWYPSFKFGEQSFDTVGSMTANREIHLYMLEIINGSQIKDGNWRMGLAIWHPTEKQYYIASSELPLRTLVSSNEVNTIFVSLLRESTLVRNLLRDAVAGQVFQAIPFLGYKLLKNTSTNEFYFQAGVGKAFSFPQGEQINITRVGYPIDTSVQSYEWFYTGTGGSIYLQSTSTVMGSISVLAAGSSLNYRLEFKAGKRLLINPSNVRMQFKDGSLWMDLPVTTINGGTSTVDANAGDTVTLGGASEAFNTLIRGKTNPTAQGARLESTIRIIRDGTIIGSVDIRYMKAGN